jgi:uncharacterized membrane protein
MRRLWKHLRAGLFWAGPLALPGAAFYYVYRYYDNMPDRFPIRWSAYGRAELWTDKNVQEVLFGPVAGWCVLMFAALAELLIFAVLRTAPVQEDADRTAQGLRQLGWLNWALGVVFAVVAILPGIAREDLQLPGWTLATCVFALAVITVFRTLRVRR